MTTRDAASRPWWEEFFDDAYADFGLARDDSNRVAETVEFIINTLGLAEGDVVFDQCCGIGRLSIPLAQQGRRVIGVDLISRYVERAKAAAAELPCEFHCADAHEFTAPRPCDGAINWFTSIGYHEDDDRNIRMFQRAAESLKPGGEYLLDFQNYCRVWRDFRPDLVDRKPRDGPGDLLVIQHNEPDFIAGVMRSQWMFVHPDGRREVRRVALRMYMPHEIIAMLKRCGFGEFRLFGCDGGEPFTRNSRRLIVAARKIS